MQARHGFLGFHQAFSLFNSEGGSTEAVHSGLARQVSSLLTNHLARATECCGNQAAGNDALQDVLSLLNDLSRYGRTAEPWEQAACLLNDWGSFGWPYLLNHVNY